MDFKRGDKAYLKLCRLDRSDECIHGLKVGDIDCFWGSEIEIISTVAFVHWAGKHYEISTPLGSLLVCEKWLQRKYKYFKPKWIDLEG